MARLAGVSTAVVSYVLNNGPAPVAPATRERVENAIEVLGYRRNASARALATGSSRLLGVILPPDIGNPFFSEVALSIEAAANLHGYAVLLSNSNNEPHTELDAIQNLVERGGRQPPAQQRSSRPPTSPSRSGRTSERCC